MARLKNDPIGAAELLEFVNTSSDFGFELRCLDRLVELGFACEHGGSYTDPVTRKTRQFDIRARKHEGTMRLRCAIECKNVAPWFPLLIMCVPRVADESFHELLFSYPPGAMDDGQQLYGPSILQKRAQAIRLDNGSSAYRVGDPIGKSAAQVRRTTDGITGTDSEVFEKWSQALASAEDLVNEAERDGERGKNLFLSLILPIVVVPNGLLWRVDYEPKSGTTINTPHQTDRCSVFVGHDYWVVDKMRSTKLTVSHLEFVTPIGLEKLIADMFVLERHWFPSIPGVTN